VTTRQFIVAQRLKSNLEYQKKFGPNYSNVEIFWENYDNNEYFIHYAVTSRSNGKVRHIITIITEDGNVTTEEKDLGGSQ